MKVVVPKSSGFCPGVKRAEEGVFELKKKSPKVNLHGPLIHNQDYITMLNECNIKDMNYNLLQNGDALVIRTHGIPKDEEQKLAEKFILEDMTCPIVKRVQKRIEKASHDDFFIIISGKPNHAEVKGLVSYAKYSIVIETEKELYDFLDKYQTIIPQNITKIYLFSQTTHSRGFFELIQEKINVLQSHYIIEIKNTICPVTENKEQESLILQKDVDFTIVIGDSKSSNSKKLFNVLKNNHDNTIFTQNKDHLHSLNINWNGVDTVLVVSSTSTPLFIEEKVVQYLQDINI